VDLDYYPVPRDIEAEVFKRLSNLLDRGGRLLVSYYRDSETLYALRKGINPVLTPIGFSMLRAGMTWFKDLYSQKVETSQALDFKAVSLLAKRSV